MRVTSVLEIPDADAERLDEVVDLAGRHAVHVGLHHHREQRPVDPAAPLQQRREERSLTQLRDLQLDIAGLASTTTAVGARCAGSCASRSARAGPAPMTAVASASINCCRIHSSDSCGSCRSSPRP